jgi:16S rRNA (cytosine967-C5)-methyltransferase
LLRDGGDLDSIRALFSGDGYGPAALSEGEISAVQNPPLGDPPLWVQGGYPAWLEPELTRAFGPDLLDEMVALQGRAAIDLRANTLKATRDQVLNALDVEGYVANPTRHSPLAIRVEPGATGLDKTSLFQSGAFEFQDEASQIASLLVDAKPGMRVLDLAAGGGGKSLAMAASMNKEGEIIATDIDAGRLRQLAMRAERAGATIIKVAATPSGEFDRVLVDAPCSGTGTWRRQPELRWRLTPEKLEALRKTQSELVDDGAPHVKPGGRLIYATCSLLPCENEDQIESFLARYPEFAIVRVRDIWPEAIGTDPPHGLSNFFKASPLSTHTDGFFTAVLARNE